MTTVTTKSDLSTTPAGFATHSVWPVTALLIGCLVCTALGMLLSPETKDADLHAVHP